MLDRILVGISRQIRQLREMLPYHVEWGGHIVVEGASGTGKEEVAAAIRQLLPKGTPFGYLGCPREQHTLIASELFGSVRGAYTGATMDRDGLFQSCNGGFVFLDDFQNASEELQGYLIRVTERKPVKRLGAKRDEPIDVRFIVATQEPLPEMVRAGKLRADLCFRLNRTPLVLPPLVERLDDIPSLVAMYLGRLTASGKPRIMVTAEAMHLLMTYTWPGNVRELGDIVDQAGMLAWMERPDAPVILPRHLPAEIQRHEAGVLRGRRPEVPVPLAVALVRSLGSCELAAERLGVSERTIRRLVAGTKGAAVNASKAS